MTTTLPAQVPSVDKMYANVGRPFVLGSMLQIPEHDYQRTWKSYDGMSWTSVPWDGEFWVPVSTAFVIVGGEVVSHFFYEDVGTLYALRSGDGHSWSVLGASTLNLLPGDTRPNNVTTFTVVHDGVVFRFTLSSGLVYVISSSNGYAFSQSSLTNLPLTYLSLSEPFLIVSFDGYLWSIPRGTEKAVYKSSDGVSWALVTSDLSISSESIVSCASDGSCLVALTSVGHTWTSTDGVVWTRKSYTEIAAIAGGSGNILLFSGDLYLLRGTKIFKRTDAGVSEIPSQPL